MTTTPAWRGICAFLALAFGLAWLPFLPVLLGADPLPPILTPFAPAIACVVVRRWVTREGFADAGLRLDLRRTWPWLALAVLWPLVTAPLSVALAVALGWGPDGLTIGGALTGASPLAVLLWVGLSVLFVPIFLGEELGWRGYLQLRLFPGRPLRAALVTGVLWGSWHYPWMLAADGGTSRDGLLMLGMFTVATTYGSVFLGWLRERTGSVWTASLGHAGNNITEDPLTRTLFSPAATTLGLGASATVLLAELGVLLLAGAGLRRQADASRARRRSAGGGPTGSTGGASASMARSEASTASFDRAG